MARLTALLLALLLACGAANARQLRVSATGSGAATGTTAAVRTESAAATDGTTEIGTAASSGTATNGSVQTSGAVEGSTGSGSTQGTAAGDAAASNSVRCGGGWRAITALLTPSAATLAGFTNAHAAGEEGATASTLTRLVAAAAGQTSTADIGSDATFTLAGSVLSDAAGMVQAAPAGALATGHTQSSTPASKAVGDLTAAGSGSLAQALAALYSSANAAPGAASASAPVDGFATGSDGAAIVSATLAKARAAIGHLRRLAQQQTATGTASGDSADVHTISACDSASGMCIGTALSSAQKADGTASTSAALQGSSGGSTTSGSTSGSGSGTGASSLSALTSITAPGAAVVGGFSTGQGTAADGTPAQGTSSTQLRAAVPDHTAKGTLQAQAAGLEGDVLANTAGVASATPTGSQVSGSVQAHTLSASHVADLLAAAGGDWSKVVALLTGQAGSGAASGSGKATASGTDGAAVTVNGSSDAHL
ncbi:hypothetical protein C2E21_4906 [Chlorella sorokiniana]|uniref:Uncharacterized protein n=1 Tax=Chlorella sorokiniana TaxID=3076 RepID=A0A2P6TQ79_CHLSO|nr:hypothetical protein C2E21_4906 [Chlorella sorokiniana]|eukprot:PRW56191.1 hypothetical protein C2E21_4906 [Chlorella sorokiniana]